MTYHLIAADDVLAAARELNSWFSLSESGIPVRIREGEAECSLHYAGGELTLCVQKRAQIFYALKLFSDEYAGEEQFSRTLTPKFEELTYMLDCSRNAVAHVDTVKELIRHLAVLGYDSFMLYTEDTFVVKQQPYFGYLRNPYTKEDIRTIDAYCALFGIELIPCIQTLAHFNSLIRHYAMDYLFDVNDILLAEEESTYAFLEDLISTCAEYFTSRRIHIGMDEAYMLGRGRYMDKHGAKSRFDIMTRHLARVNELCEKYHFRPMMWSDMFFSLAMSAQYGDELPASLVENVPRNIELVYWDYCSIDREHYAALIKKHRAFPNEIVFAGGAWKWLGYTPDNRYALTSIGAAGEACIETGVTRYIVTGWGDNGAECSVFATLPALHYAARMKYGSFETDEAFRHSFETLSGMPCESFMTIDLGNRITRHDDVEEKNSANKYLLFNDILLGTLDTTIVEGLDELYGEHVAVLDKAAERAGKWAYLFRTQAALCRVLALKADLGVVLRRCYQAGDRAGLAAAFERLKALPQAIEAFYELLRAQWDAENRPNGFDVQDLRIGALRQRVDTAIRKVGDYLAGRCDRVPELDEKLLCFMGHGEEFEKDFDQCEWRWRRMTSVNVNE